MITRVLLFLSLRTPKRYWFASIWRQGVGLKFVLLKLLNFLLNICKWFFFLLDVRLKKLLKFLDLKFLFKNVKMQIWNFINHQNFNTFLHKNYLTICQLITLILSCAKWYQLFNFSLIKLLSKSLNYFIFNVEYSWFHILKH